MSLDKNNKIFAMTIAELIAIIVCTFVTIWLGMKAYEAQTDGNVAGVIYYMIWVCLTIRRING
jgi:hypothetical protein